MIFFRTEYDCANKCGELGYSHCNAYLFNYRDLHCELGILDPMDTILAHEDVGLRVHVHTNFSTREFVIEDVIHYIQSNFKGYCII